MSGKNANVSGKNAKSVREKRGTIDKCPTRRIKLDKYKVKAVYESRIKQKDRQ